MSRYTPGESSANRGLKTAVAIVGGVAVMVLIAVIVLVLQRPGGEGSASGTDDESATEGVAVSVSQAEIGQLTEGRAAALKDKDEKAFTAAFAGDARAQARRLFRNLRKVPLTSASFRHVETIGRLENSFGGGVNATIDVHFEHQITGVDLAPVVEGYRWQIEKKNPKSTPVITKISGIPFKKVTDDDPDTALAYPAPWDLYEDLRIYRGDHLVLMSSAGQAEQARRDAPGLERAARGALSAWKQAGAASKPVAPGFAVTVEPDKRQSGRLYGRSEARGEAGVEIPMRGAGTAVSYPYAGGRVVLQEATERVGEHEMAHALLTPLIGQTSATALDGPQNWLVEGFAEYVASRGEDDRGGQSALRRAGFDGRLPNQLMFYSQDATHTAANYELGRLAVKFIAETQGKQKAFSFVAAQYGEPSKLDEQLKDATGLDKQAFEAQWAEHVRSTLR